MLRTLLSYVLTVMNLGPGPADNVVLTDILPPLVRVDSLSVGCIPVGRIVTCNLGTIAQGESRSVRINVESLAPGTITNVASVEGTGTNVAQATHTTRVLAFSRIVLSKNGAPNPAFVGGILTYTVRVFNEGLVPAENVTLVDALPPSVTLLSASAPCTLGPNNRLACELGTIPVNNEVTVTIQFRPNEPGRIVNAADATGITPLGALSRGSPRSLQLPTWR